MGEALTHWTIRLALLCLAARLGGALLFPQSDGWLRRLRVIWTVGCILFLLHVASAFHFYHDWRHAQAFETTASRTFDMVGVRFGEGIYFSYLFMLLWTSDVAWWWLWPQSHNRRANWLTVTVLVYMGFIAFNGAVVFEDGVTRWLGIPLTAALLLAAISVWRTGRNHASEPAAPQSLAEGNP